MSVIPGSPADHAGIIDGDVIESIGNQSTRVMPLQMIRMSLDGQPGSMVHFSVIEPTSATPDAMTLTRALADYPAMHVDEYDNSSILYLKPYDLSQNRVDDILHPELRQVPDRWKAEGFAGHCGMSPTGIWTLRFNWRTHS